MDRAGANPSLWMEGPLAQTYPSLSEDVTSDVIVVGGGITGLTAALKLLESGRSVTLIEMNRIGSGTTGSSTGHLDNYTDQTITGLIRAAGEDNARIALSAKRSAIDHIEARTLQYNIDCQFTRIPAYLYCEDETDVEMLKQEYAAARRLAIPVDMQRHAPLPFNSAISLMFPDQARFDPLAYIRGLARAVVAAGGRIHENTRAEKIWEENGRARVETNHGNISAQDIILAGHAPLLGMFTVEPRAIPFQSYVLAARVLNAVPDALYWDTADPYHYTRLARAGDPHLLLIGGADHHTGAQIDTNDRFRDLDRYARTRYRVDTVEYRWSHEFFETADGLPYIGRVPTFEHTYVCAAYSGDGLTFGTVAGLLTSELIAGVQNPAAKLFDPSRLKPLSTVRRLTSNLLHMARHFVGDRLMSADYESMDEIAPGQGGLVNVEGERLAVFRDEHGETHMMSPVCRHMGCYVHWNSAEQTWDCPCHGGRYDAYGNVIMGPPKQSLEARAPVTAETR